MRLHDGDFLLFNYRLKAVLLSEAFAESFIRIHGFERSEHLSNIARMQFENENLPPVGLWI